MIEPTPSASSTSDGQTSRRVFPRPGKQLGFHAAPILALRSVVTGARRRSGRATIDGRRLNGVLKGYSLKPSL